MRECEWRKCRFFCSCPFDERTSAVDWYDSDGQSTKNCYVLSKRFRSKIRGVTPLAFPLRSPSDGSGWSKCDMPVRYSDVSICCIWIRYLCESRNDLSPLLASISLSLSQCSIDWISIGKPSNFRSISSTMGEFLFHCNVRRFGLANNTLPARTCSPCDNLSIREDGLWPLYVRSLQSIFTFIAIIHNNILLLLFHLAILIIDVDALQPNMEPHIWFFFFRWVLCEKNSWKRCRVL